jgi:hypothetical protein
MAKITANGKAHKVTQKKVDKGAGKKGDIIVEQNSKTGKKQRMNLTKLAGAKTVAQGVKATKKFHRQHPEVK